MSYQHLTKPRTKNGHVHTERQARIYNFLHEHPVGVLSSVSPDGDPHGTVIYYAIDMQFAITFLTKANTKKYDNLKHNNHVMLTVFESGTQSTAQIIGTATEIIGSRNVTGIAGEILSASMRTSESKIPPISKLQAGAYVAFRIEPAQIRMAVFGRTDPGDYTELFETVESFQLNGY